MAHDGQNRLTNVSIVQIAEVRTKAVTEVLVDTLERSIVGSPHLDEHDDVLYPQCQTVRTPGYGGQVRAGQVTHEDQRCDVDEEQHRFS